MSEQAVQPGHGAVQGGSRSSPAANISQRRTSSKSTIIGVGVAGVLLTALAIAGVVMMSGPASAPVSTQVATISAPTIVAPAPIAAPAYIPAPVQPAPIVTPALDVAPALAPVPAPAPALNMPGQCQIGGQRQQLAINLSATKRGEVGNVIRVHSGTYVSPPIVLTRSIQTVMFPAPPGATDSARIIIEQSTTGGSTFDDVDGITSEFAGNIDAHRDFVLLRWSTPRC
jgi:hypothetical protein